MEENKQNQDKTVGPWWKPGVVIFSQVSVWIVVPILLALFIGKSLDAHFGTKPIIFLVLASLGFLFTCFGIVRIVKRYIKEIQDLSLPKDNSQSEIKKQDN